MPSEIPGQLPAQFARYEEPLTGISALVAASGTNAVCCHLSTNCYKHCPFSVSFWSVVKFHRLSQWILWSESWVGLHGSIQKCLGVWLSTLGSLSPLEKLWCGEVILATAVLIWRGEMWSNEVLLHPTVQGSASACPQVLGFSQWWLVCEELTEVKNNLCHCLDNITPFFITF